MYTVDSIGMIIAGVIVGLVFGFLLQKAAVTRYSTILGQFLFKDFTVLKVMLTAIVTGGLGIWGMLQFGMLELGDLHVKNAVLASNIAGGLIFGVGMALLGYCPGTGVAALGDKSRHAIPGLIGMIVGGGLYAEFYPAIKDGFLKMWSVTVGDSGKVTLPAMTELSPWWFMASLAVIALVVFLLIERFGPRQHA